MFAVRAYVGYKAEKAARLFETEDAKKILLDAHHRAYPKLIHKFTPVFWSRGEDTGETSGYGEEIKCVFMRSPP